MLTQRDLASHTPRNFRIPFPGGNDRFFQAGGLGGGAINVALLLQVFNYSSKPATAVSAALIFGGCVGKYSFTSK